MEERNPNNTIISEIREDDRESFGTEQMYFKMYLIPGGGHQRLQLVFPENNPPYSRPERKE